MRSLHPRDSERAGGRDTQVRHAALVWCWRLRLARRATVVRRRREASRRCGALLWGVVRPHPARHGALAQKACVPRLLTRDRERRRASAAQDTRRWLGVRAHSWDVTPRPHAEGEMPIAGTAPFYEAPYEHNQRATARAYRKLACCASSPATESTGAPPLSDTRRWLDVEDHGWQVAPWARAVGARPLTDVSSFYRLRDDHNQRGMARASGKLKRCAPPHKQRAQVRLR